MTFSAFAYVTLIFRSLEPLPKCLKGWNFQRHPRGCPRDGRVHKNKRVPRGPQPNVPPEQVDAETHGSDRERESNIYFSAAFEPHFLHDAVFSPGLKLAIQETVSSSVTEALQVFSNQEAQIRFSDYPHTPRLPILNAATSLGLHLLLEKKPRRQNLTLRLYDQTDCSDQQQKNSPPSRCLLWPQRAL